MTSALYKPATTGPQSGVSRELFDQWADNPRNGLIIADFAVAGTMARQVLDSPPEVLTRSGLKVRAARDLSRHITAKPSNATHFRMLGSTPGEVLTRAGFELRAARDFHRRAVT